MNRARMCSLLFAFCLSLAGCSTVRQSKPLVYAGEDPRTSVASLETSIKKRGYKPICEEEAFCKFQIGSSVWVHYKASSKKIVMAVDVVDGKEMAADKRKALVDEGTKIGEEIWNEASADAQQREKNAAENARAEAERKKAEEAEKKRAEAERDAAEKKNGSTSGTDGLTGVLNAATGVLGGVAKAQSNTSSTCCINGAYYHCASPSALNKCAGEFSACVTKCVLGSDMSCPDRCLKEHPPDPSGCDRTPARDNECPAK